MTDPDGARETLPRPVYIASASPEMARLTTLGRFTLLPDTDIIISGQNHAPWEAVLSVSKLGGTE